MHSTLSDTVLKFLGEREAVLTGQHFVFTSGNHGSAYINMRQVAHHATFLWRVAVEMVEPVRMGLITADFILGPETLGRNLAGYAGQDLGLPAIWCDIVKEDGVKKAVFSPKLNFDRLLPDQKVFIVDDLLTTGSSIRLVVEAAQAAGAEVVGASAVVRRTPDVVAATCNVPELNVIADVEGFEVFTPDECAAHGPCSREEPIVLRPGHGIAYQEKHPDYPGGYTELLTA
ncbi:hypothetical protein E6P97_00720 [Patescibacteria group bacterium]|nr:MAG: hypothetical protein E6P97_00720 [Patescibacteria group bacterium]